MNIKQLAQKANAKSPLLLWERWGFSVQPAGDELRVYNADNNCVYRSVKQPDNRWLSTMSDAGVGIAPHVGDNISLFQYGEMQFMNKSKPPTFTTALSKILFICKNESEDGHFKKVTSHYASSSPDGVNLPLPTTKGNMKGKIYLQSRGISSAIIDQAYKSNTIQFVDSSEHYAASVLFVGYNSLNLPVFANKRCIEPPKSHDHGRNKRDLANSNKVFVPFLKGSEEIVFFVEGGVNMLTIAELFTRNNKAIPTVIMTGGQGSLKWSENPFIIDILSKSHHVLFIEENDFHLSEAKQQQNKELKEKQRQQASQISGHEAVIIPLPHKYGDINDLIIENNADDIQYITDVISEYTENHQLSTHTETPQC